MDKNYWDSRYREKKTAWDLGEISPPLKKFFDQIKDKKIKILIPGSGNSHEVKYLWEEGFVNVHALDISEKAFDGLRKNCPSFPEIQMICEDFFNHKGEYDLIVEQTFFCALVPDKREDYVVKMADLLKEEGELIGLLFNVQFDGGPPFGGEREAYYPLFGKYLNVIKMEEAYNSVKPRAKSELFFRAKTKPNF